MASRRLSRASPSDRGRFVALVGPDGVGKTTVAIAVCAARESSAYFHFYPPLSGDLPPRPPFGALPNPDKSPRRGSVLLGVIRITRNYIRFWLGYILRVRPLLKQGTLVVADRWAYGYLVQPHALKFSGPQWLAQLAVASLPSPDLVANLTAPPEVIHERKQELSLEQINGELHAWAGVSAPSVVSFDTQDTPEEVAGRILAEAYR